MLSRWSAAGALRLVGLGVVAGVVIPAMAFAAPPPLVKTTSIAGERTGYAEVVLPKPLRPFSDEDMPEIGLEGGGAILGAVLRTGPAADGRYTTLKILRMDRRNEGSAILYSVGNGENGLPAGAYRLYLIVEKAGRVTLDFPSLPDGELAVAPSVSTPFDAGALPVRPWPSPATTTFGRNGELTSDGFVYSRAVVEDAPPGARLEACVYGEDQQAAAGERTYGPGCPSGTAGHSETAVEPGQLGVWAMSIFPDAGRIGHGGNVTGPLPLAPAAIDTFGMWMSYDFPRPVASPPPNRPLEHPEPSGTAMPAARRIEVRNGSARVPVNCPSDGRCRGHVRLTGATRKVAFDIPVGDARTLKAPLSRSMRRRVARRRKVRARLVAVTIAPGIRRQVDARVRLVRAPR